MDYFETERESGTGRCSDDKCPCPPPGTLIPRGAGYLYISRQVVEFHRDARTLAAHRAKVDRIASQYAARGVDRVWVSPGVFNPILMCEQGARRRGLDMEIAAADARYWWETGLVPLRPTPRASLTSWWRTLWRRKERQSTSDTASNHALPEPEPRRQDSTSAPRQCLECGHGVERNAVVCPKCGFGRFGPRSND